MTIDKSFLFKIQDYLPALESLDVSECEWMDPATLLPLSKLPALQELFLRDCHKLAEFVAYASLTARYGFRTLKVLDLRGSPVGDSEVSALGWLPQLERLWLAAARVENRSPHAHYADDAETWHTELEHWETAEREYFKSRPSNGTLEETTPGCKYDGEKEAARQEQRTDRATCDDRGEKKENKKRKTSDEMNGGEGGKRARVGGGAEANGERAGRDGRDRENNRHRNSPDCIVDCIKIDQLIDVGELRRGRQNEVIVIANSAKVRSPTRPAPHDRYVCLRRSRDRDGGQGEGGEGSGSVNQGASTSRDHKDGDDTDNEDDASDNGNEKYVHFRQNREPVFVDCAPPEPPPPVQYQIEPRHHVLYVSVGPQVNTYRFPRDSADLERQVCLSLAPAHVDSSSLVTDFAIRRFGRADGEDVNIIHIGPNGPMLVGQSAGSRPDRSNLRLLSVTGYRNITDRSLSHLASAAPRLASLDFRETNVSEAGARSFLALRPDCELVYSAFVDDKDN
ncbi:F-box/LRR-repeat protein 12 [Danaus plexippus plexippus]|uniref:F-box/LRR-repeat protein 12 n=2 Tax=Danaus plexippus TaxID=13037 RepID=A0A212FE65_DANPL|nr:F-box/LRR-repeat protein 12 [Danaus plexippus plexippus]